MSDRKKFDDLMKEYLFDVLGRVKSGDSPDQVYRHFSGFPQYAAGTWIHLNQKSFYSSENLEEPRDYPQSVGDIIDETRHGGNMIGGNRE